MPPKHAAESPELSRRKKAAFALLALILAAALLEGALALAGVRPMLFERDPYVGFASSSPLFVEQAGADGQVWMETSKRFLEFFNPQRFPKQKAGNTFRIFSMGGSTTYGHPYSDPTSFNGWLREFLAATAPDRKWEAINAGGISYGSYRVARLMEELAQFQPDLFVIYSGHNEFLEKRIYRKITQEPAALRSLGILARKTRTGTVLAKAVEAAVRPRSSEPETVLGDLPQTLLDNALGPTEYRRAEQDREQIFAHYQFNLERMIGLARAAGARVIFVNPASNLRDCSPFKSEFREGLPEDERQRCAALLRKAREEFFANRAAEAMKIADEAAQIDPSYAEAHYVRGRILEKLGRFSDAREALLRARDEDVCALRAPAAIGKILAQVCREKNVPLIDFQAMADSASENGLTSSKLFLDHVHPTVDGYRMIALEILRTMEREKIGPVAIRTEAIGQATKLVHSRIDARANSFALMNLCKTLGWAGKREEAYRAGEQAARLAPDDARVRYEAGLAAQLARRPAEAIEHFQKVLALEPAHPEAHCTLGFLLESQGDLQGALAQYKLALQHGKPETRARDHYNLTNTQAKLAR